METGESKLVVERNVSLVSRNESCSGRFDFFFFFLLILRASRANKMDHVIKEKPLVDPFPG